MGKTPSDVASTANDKKVLVGLITMKPKSIQVIQKEDIRKNYPKENVYFADSNVMPDSLKEDIRKKFGNNSKIGKVVVHPGLPKEKTENVKKLFIEKGIKVD